MRAYVRSAEVVPSVAGGADTGAGYGYCDNFANDAVCYLRQENWPGYGIEYIRAELW